MKRSTITALLDAAAFLALACTTSVGLMLKFRLPPGSGGPVGAGIGIMAGEQPVRFLWGLHRHQWGEVHFWLAAIFVLLLALHLFLHWKWVVATVRGTDSGKARTRTAAGVVGLASVLTLAAAPFLAPVRAVHRKVLHGSIAAPAPASTPATRSPLTKRPMESAHPSERIRGSMTISQTAEVMGIPAESLIRQLGLPPTTSSNARLGRLRRRYGFTMTKIRSIDRTEEQ